MSSRRWKKTSRKVGGTSGKGSLYDFDGGYEWLSIGKYSNGGYYILLRTHNSITNRWSSGSLLFKDLDTEKEALSFAKDYMGNH